MLMYVVSNFSFYAVQHHLRIHRHLPLILLRAQHTALAGKYIHVICDVDCILHASFPFWFEP